MPFYQSTRGGDKNKSFEDVLVSTYASDGGLYVPMTLPQISVEQLSAWAHLSYADLAAEILHLFTEIDRETLRGMTARALSNFNREELDRPIPLRRFDDYLLLDLSLGPTYAFKDIGQQLVAQLLDYYLSKRDGHATIMVETSGDTGPAAIAAVKQCKNIDIYCLYPHLRVSDVQELQMITIQEENVHIYRTEGNSDDQAYVLKEIFADKEFTAKYNVCSINSINWARICAQSTYYFWSYLQVYGTVDSIGNPVDYCIPTGAFGNGMGCYLAKLMGLPIGRIICATNANDLVSRTLHKGDMSITESIATLSPAMDIQFAYNLERLLYFLLEGDTTQVASIFSAMEDTGKVQLSEEIVGKLHELYEAHAVSDEATLQAMKSFHEKYNFLLCPHSAVGVHIAGLVKAENPLISVLTAHPAKFSSTVKTATSQDVPLPADIAAMFSLPHRYKALTKTREDWKQDWIQTLKSDLEVNSQV